MDVKSVVDRYQRIRPEREARAKAFVDGTRPYLIFQSPGGDVWSDARDPEDCFNRNLRFVSDSLDLPSDDLPIMEAWYGTGLYANIFGCPYVWRKGEAPAVHYKYHSLGEVKGLRKPRWEESEIARLVLSTIDYFKSRTGDAIPIIWSDTQSAHDTATLVLDACEVFAGCLEEPEAVMDFMRTINEVIIEFSRVQAERIGGALVHPGHIMLSNAHLRGMSISDDNLAVGSPAVNARFNLPLDDAIGRAMGGVAIHSCGRWSHTMGMIKELCPSCVAIDCALETGGDPNPNEPEAVRDALAGSGIHLHVRMTGDTESMVEVVKRVLHPKLKLIVHPNFEGLPAAQRNYEVLDQLLGDSYSQGARK